MPYQHGLWRDYFPYWDCPKNIAPSLAAYLGYGPINQDELNFALAVEAMPKIELHVHMEAAVPALFYAGLNNRRELFRQDQLPANRAPFLNLKAFIGAWLDHCRLIDAETLFREMARQFVHSRALSHIVYTEAYISPFDYSFGRMRLKTPEKPLDYRLVLENYLIGLKEGLASHPGIRVRLIVDTLWLTNEIECQEMYEALRSLLRTDLAHDDIDKTPLIVAIGMGGAEQAERAIEKKLFIEKCRDLGLKLDIHSGETTSEREHLQSVDILKPDRVAHGISPAVRPSSEVNNPSATNFFKGGIAACPVSNILTGAFSGDLANHPIKQMIEGGFRVCVNTDDPLLFGNNLTLEFLALRRSLGFDLATVEHLTEMAVQMAFTEVGQRFKSQ